MPVMLRHSSWFAEATLPMPVGMALKYARRVGPENGLQDNFFKTQGSAKKGSTPAGNGLAPC